MLTALLCVKMIQAEIHQLFQGRACTNTNLVKLEIKKRCGYLEYKVKVIIILLTLFCLQTMYLCNL